MKKLLQAVGVAVISLSATGCLDSHERDLRNVWDEIWQGNYEAFAARLDFTDRAIYSQQLTACDRECFDRIRWGTMSHARGRVFAPGHQSGDPWVTYSTEGVPQSLRFPVYVGHSPTYENSDLRLWVKCDVEVVGEGLAQERPAPAPQTSSPTFFDHSPYFYVSDAFSTRTFQPSGEPYDSESSRYVTTGFVDRLILMGVEALGRKTYQIQTLPGCKLSQLELRSEEMRTTPSAENLARMEEWKQDRLNQLAVDAAADAAEEAETAATSLTE